MARRLALCLSLIFCVAVAAAQLMGPARVRVSSKIMSGLSQTKVPPVYPPLARQARIQGVVILQAIISKAGDVEEVELISGHPMLAPAAIEAVKQWKYRPYLLNGEAVQVETQVQVNFTLSDSRPQPDSRGGLLQVSEAVMRPLRTLALYPEYPALAVETRVQGKVILNIDINTSGEVDTVMPFTGPAVLTAAAIVEVRRWTYEPYLLNGVPTKVKTSVSLNFVLSGENESQVSVTDLPLPSDSADIARIGSAGDPNPLLQTALPKRIRVSAGAAQGLLLTKINPAYPPDAKQARLQGEVILKVNISEDGTVKTVELISGHPLLAPAAIDAVKQWTYRPYLLNGNPIEVETQVRVSFTLAGG